MATYPSINITTNTRATDNIVYLPSNVFIYGFTDRGPEKQQVAITSTKDFLTVYGKPNTSVEYAMYEAVNNTIAGRGTALCYRIPYIEQIDVSANINSISYYCNANETIPISAAIQLSPDSVDILAANTYIESAISNKLGTGEYSSAQTLAWHLTETSADTHVITLTPKSKTRTIFDYDISGNVVVNVQPEQRSLGILPMFLGSLNTLYVTTGYAGIVDQLRANLQIGICFTMLQTELSSSADIFKTPLLNEYRYVTTANDIYVDGLDVIATSFNNFDVSTIRTNSAVIIAEIFINDNNEITAKILEYFVGVLDTSSTEYDKNLIDTINEQSNFIKMSCKSTVDMTDALVDIGDNNLWQFVDFPTDAAPIYAFGNATSLYDCTIDDEKAYQVNSDSIFNAGGLVDHINAMSHKPFIDDRIYDYVVMPSLVDCFNTATSAISATSDISAKYMPTTYAGIEFNSGAYYIPHSNTETTLNKFNSDTANCVALLTTANKFADIDKDCTIFFDVPLKTAYTLADIVNSNLPIAKQTAMTIDTMTELNLIPVNKPFANKNNKNVFFTFNNQVIDKFNIAGDYACVPASVEMLYVYCYADYYRYACPLAGSQVVKLFRQCHGGVIAAKHKNIFKLLFNTYLINSLMSDINNNIMPNQQTLCRHTTSVFAQHHAFRLAKYLKRHLKQLAISFLYEPNTQPVRQAFTDAITKLLSRYRDGGVISAYTVVCDNTNNTTQTIENNELHCLVTVTILGAVVTVNVNITQLDVSISLD